MTLATEMTFIEQEREKLSRQNQALGDEERPKVDDHIWWACGKLGWVQSELCVITQEFRFVNPEKAQEIFERSWEDLYLRLIHRGMLEPAV